MSPRKSITYIALFALLIAQLGGAHGHYCFDGQEPAFSVHFDNMLGHEEHDPSEQGHNDTDMDLGSQLLIKFFEADLSLLLPSLFLLFLLPSFGRWYYLVSYTPTTRRRPTAFLPPLRAPPGTR